jgi:hypothetical protein
MAYRLSVYVTRTEDIYTQLYHTIEAFKKGDVPPQIPGKLKDKLEEMELKTQPGLCKERLSPAERKAIIRAVTWFLDDIETILKHMDRVIDMVPKATGKLMELSDQLDINASILRRDFQNMKELLPESGGDEAAWTIALNNEEVINFCDKTITTIVISFQKCIEVYEVVTDAMKDLPYDK